MNAQKARDVEALVAAIVAQAPPLTPEQQQLIRDAYRETRTCERRPAPAAAALAPTDVPAAVQNVGGRGAA